MAKAKTTRFIAVVHVTQDVEFTAEVPEAVLEVGERAGGRHVHVMVNEASLLKARAKVARDTEKAVKAMFPKAREVYIEEVREA